MTEKRLYSFDQKAFKDQFRFNPFAKKKESSRQLNTTKDFFDALSSTNSDCEDDSFQKPSSLLRQSSRTNKTPKQAHDSASTTRRASSSWNTFKEQAAEVHNRQEEHLTLISYSTEQSSAVTSSQLVAKCAESAKVVEKSNADNKIAVEEPIYDASPSIQKSYQTKQDVVTAEISVQTSPHLLSSLPQFLLKQQPQKESLPFDLPSAEKLSQPDTEIPAAQNASKILSSGTFVDNTAESPALSPRTVRTPAPPPTATKTPATLQSTIKTLAASQSAAKTPAASKSAAKTPAASKSAAKTPAASKSAAKTPAASKSAAKTPTASKSAAKTPAALQSTEKTPAALQDTAKTPAVSQRKAKTPADSQRKVKTPVTIHGVATPPATYCNSAGASITTHSIAKTPGMTHSGIKAPPPSRATPSQVVSQFITSKADPFVDTDKHRYIQKWLNNPQNADADGTVNMEELPDVDDMPKRRLNFSNSSSYAAIRKSTPERLANRKEETEEDMEITAGGDALNHVEVVADVENVHLCGVPESTTENDDAANAVEVIAGEEEAIDMEIIVDDGVAAEDITVKTGQKQSMNNSAVDGAEGDLEEVSEKALSVAVEEQQLVNKTGRKRKYKKTLENLLDNGVTLLANDDVEEQSGLRRSKRQRVPRKIQAYTDSYEIIYYTLNTRGSNFVAEVCSPKVQSNLKIKKKKPTAKNTTSVHSKSRSTAPKKAVKNKKKLSKTQRKSKKQIRSLSVSTINEVQKETDKAREEASPDVEEELPETGDIEVDVIGYNKEASLPLDHCSSNNGDTAVNKVAEKLNRLNKSKKSSLNLPTSSHENSHGLNKVNRTSVQEENYDNDELTKLTTLGRNKTKKKKVAKRPTAEVSKNKNLILNDEPQKDKTLTKSGKANKELSLKKSRRSNAGASEQEKSTDNEVSDQEITTKRQSKRLTTASKQLIASTKSKRTKKSLAASQKRSKKTAQKENHSNNDALSDKSSITLSQSKMASPANKISRTTISKSILQGRQKVIKHSKEASARDPEVSRSNKKAGFEASKKSNKTDKPAPKASIRQKNQGGKVLNDAKETDKKDQDFWFSRESPTSGILFIAPNKRKRRSWTSPNQALILFVKNGAVKVSVDGYGKKVVADGVARVDSNSKYSVKNLTSSIVRIQYQILPVH